MVQLLNRDYLARLDGQVVVIRPPALETGRVSADGTI